MCGPRQKSFVSAETSLRDSLELGMQVVIAPDRQTKEVRSHAIDDFVSRLTFDDVLDFGRSLQAVLEELERRCRRNLLEQIRIATVYYKPARNLTKIEPDYFIRATDDWLVFPHEVQGLTREEILQHKPVDECFFSPYSK